MCASLIIDALVRPQFFVSHQCCSYQAMRGREGITIITNSIREQKRAAVLVEIERPLVFYCGWYMNHALSGKTIWQPDIWLHADLKVCCTSSI